MKHLYFFLIGIAITFTVNAKNAITMEQVVNGDFNAETFGKVTPLNDGESFARLNNNDKQILKFSFKTGQQTEVLFDVATARGKKLSKIDGFIFSPDESRILIQTETENIYRHSTKAQYYIFTISNNSLEPLSQNGPQEQPLFSPDGNQIAFVRDNNLFLVKLLFNNSESQVTSDGKFNQIINGLPDWVNEEEFSFARAFDFSADSKILAWIHYDESMVSLFEIPLYKGMCPEKSEYAKYPGKYNYKYPIAGATNSKVCVKTYDIKAHVTRTMDIPMDTDSYIPRIKFTSTPDQLAIVTLNRHQNIMDIYMGNARSKICKLAHREQNDKYVAEKAYQQLHFYGNHFVLMSEKSGYCQLYWYSTTGQLEKQLTNENNDVIQFYGYEPSTNSFYYSAQDDGPLHTAIYCTDLKGKTKKLSTQRGTNNALFSHTFKYYINEYSNLTTPPVISVCNNDGHTEKTLITNEQLKAQTENLDFAKKELFTFKTSQGVELNGWMMKPSNFNPSHKYPVILYQYSGPGSQEVKDSWDVGFYNGGTFESYLADKGFIVVCVDGRGTGGRGADFEKCTYLNLGRFEAKDQVETAIYLGNLPYIDKNNIGIWGWSYGGFNTLMSMSEGRPVFKAGVAVAPLATLRFYDTVYTERYMRTPAENPDGYDYNALNRVRNLNGALLICHGLADDNVHFQNTAEYSEALVQAGKQFDMQVYTNRNHSIFGGNTRLHLFNRIASFFIQNLK